MRIIPPRKKPVTTVELMNLAAPVAGRKSRKPPGPSGWPLSSTACTTPFTTALAAITISIASDQTIACCL